MSHTDDWLITYADMITLLLCLFVVFVGVSASRKESAHKAPAQQLTAVAVTAPIPPPVPQSHDPPSSLQLPAKVLEALQVIPPFHDDEQVDHPVAGPAEAMSVKTDEPPHQMKASAVTAAISAPKTEGARPPAPVETASASPSHPANHPNPRKLANIEPEGDRITTLEMSSAAFFDSGSASLSSAGKALLQEMAAALSADRFKNYRITVEGHTDDTPINTPQFPSNWELSTARASAVVRFLLEQGIPAQRLRAAGYADTFPKAPNRDASGNPIPENQALNRRVVIKLEKIDQQSASAAPGRQNGT